MNEPIYLYNKIGILGFGRSGQDLTDFILPRLRVKNTQEYSKENSQRSTNTHKERNSSSQLYIYTNNVDDIKLDPYRSNQDVLICLDSEQTTELPDLLLLSPGIARDHPLVQKCINSNVDVWGEIEFAYRYCHKEIIAITGSNGKSSTVSMLGHALNSIDVKAKVAGNIGESFISIIDNQEKYDFIVLELSSFQLESITSFRSKFAIILNCVMTHEERYSSFEDYFKAKQKIFSFQLKSDFFITSEELSQSPLLLKHKSQLVLYKREERIIGSEFLSFGKFVKINASACLKIFDLLVQFGFVDEKSEHGFIQALYSFKGLEHRLERVSYKNLIVINDSKSTNLFSTLMAIESVQQMSLRESKLKHSAKAKISLLIGGALRQELDKKKINQILEATSSVDQVFIYGELGEKLKHNEHFCDKKFRILARLREISDFIPDSGFLLFSPGFPSFDQFKNFEERGAYFKNLLKSNPS